MGIKRIGVRKASQTSIEISFTYQGQRCRERIRLEPTPPNLNRAKRHRAVILDSIDRGSFDYAATFPKSKKKDCFKQTANLTLMVYLKNWNRHHKKNLKASTAQTNQKIINQISGAIGKILISDLRWIDVKNWLMDQPITTKTMSNKLSVLRHALNEAVDDELIDFNPLQGKRLAGNTSSHKRERIDPFDEVERTAILSACQGQLHNIIKFAFWTGLRTSELCALNWSDIDFKRSLVRINKSFTMAASEPEGPKTDAGIRSVKLFPPAIAALKSQQEHTFLKNKEIFQNPYTMDRWRGDRPLRDQWKKVLIQADISYRYPYQTRHSYATMMLMAGEHVMWVSNQMGHTSWAFTATTYSKWIDSTLQDAGNKAVKAYKL